MVTAQKGPTDFVENYNKYLPTAVLSKPVFAEKTGFITEMDTRALGMSVVTLGGGRRKATDAIDYSVGLSDIAALGAEINTDTPLAMIHANSEKSWQEAAAEVRKAMVIGDSKREASPMVYRQISE